MMHCYIFDEQYINLENKKKVEALLDSIPESSLRIEGQKNYDEAFDEVLEKIRALGELKVAEFLQETGLELE